MYVSLRNRSLLPAPQVVVDDVAGDLDPAVRAVEAPSLGPRTRRTLTVPLRPAARGVHRLPPLRTATMDPLGLVRNCRVGGDAQEVIVHPRLVVLDSCLLLPEVGERELTRTGGRASPGGLDFRDIRPHNPGEPLTRVDWKATARSGNLMLRETDDPAENDVAVVLDGAAAAVVGEPPRTSFEVAVEAVAAICDYLLRTGHSVGLAPHQSAREPARITPGAGSRDALLERLARVRADARVPVSTALRESRGGPSARPRTLVLVTSALDRDLARALAGLRRRGAAVSVLIVDPETFPADGAGRGREASAVSGTAWAPDGRAADEDEPASGGRQTQAAAALLTLAHAGIVSLSVGRDDDLRDALSRTRAAGPRQRGRDRGERVSTVAMP